MPSTTERYEWVVPVEGEGALVMDGTPLADTWKVPSVRLVNDLGDGRLRSRADLPFWGTDALVMTDRAVSELEPLLASVGEVLPLDSATGRLWLLNVTNVADVLDRQHSGFTRLSDGRVVEIRPAVFEANREIPELFRLPDELDSRMYFTDTFIRRVEDAGLEGLGYQVAGYAPKRP